MDGHGWTFTDLHRTWRTLALACGNSGRERHHVNHLVEGYHTPMQIAGWSSELLAGYTGNDYRVTPTNKKSSYENNIPKKKGNENNLPLQTTNHRIKTLLNLLECWPGKKQIGPQKNYTQMRRIIALSNWSESILHGTIPQFQSISMEFLSPSLSYIYIININTIPYIYIYMIERESW